MRIDAELVTSLRTGRGWSQAELAEAAGLNLRTVQRIEASGVASLRSKRMIASALEIDPADLDHQELTMSPCPQCRSEQVYQAEKSVDTTTIGGGLVPKLASGPFSSAELRVVICGACGLVRYFVDDGARSQLEASPHWKLV